MKVDMQTLHQESDPKIGPTELQEGHTAQQGQNSTKTSTSYLDKVDIRDGGFLIEWGGLDSDRRFPAENTVKEVGCPLHVGWSHDLKEHKKAGRGSWRLWYCCIEKRRVGRRWGPRLHPHRGW